MKIFLKREKKQIDAVAEYDFDTGSVTVLKGSVVCTEISQAPTFRGRTALEKQRKMYVKNNIVLENVTFKSSSTAGNFVTGGSTDGPRSWRDEKGHTLKSLLMEEVIHNDI